MDPRPARRGLRIPAETRTKPPSAQARACNFSRPEGTHESEIVNDLTTLKKTSPSPSRRAPVRSDLGFHYDLHAKAEDTQLGLRADPRNLAAMLRRMRPDFVQTDCKGHPGYTSWFSKTPGASVPAALKKDALAQWREATRQLGLPLHCHYSSVYDTAAIARHPEWAAQSLEASALKPGQNAGAPLGSRACLRSGYLDELLIPQLRELIDRYDVDGFWLDGDIWAVDVCYCPRCRDAYREQTGAEPPESPEDPGWSAWWNFTRETHEAWVTRICDAVHTHRPGVRVCANWLQTFNAPGEPKAPTDWISGDNNCVYGLDQSRCEARFLSTRGKPWDIMLWGFYFPTWDEKFIHNSFKSFDMLAQEAAIILSFGGALQFYDHPKGLRDGRLVGWHMDRLGEVAKFVRSRLPLCRDSETVPHIAVLHSEHHFRATAKGTNLFFNVDTAPVKGAVFALLESHLGVDVLDEWALLPRLAEFPMIVVPEQHAMSDAMVAALTAYVENGGTLLLTGAETGARWPDRFLGVTGRKTLTDPLLFFPVRGESGSVHSATCRLIKPKGAEPFGELARTDEIAGTSLGHPAATIHRWGRGQVAFVPFNLFRNFQKNRFIQTRRFVEDLVAALKVPWTATVEALRGVDVAYRRQGDTLLAHFVNRTNGIPNQPENGAVDDIPFVGPVTLRWRLPKRPASVELAFEKGDLEWTWSRGILTVRVPRLRIHAAVVIRPR